MSKEYIDREELYNIEKLLKTSLVEKDKVALNIVEQVLFDIKAIPKADVEPVKHGKWKGHTSSAYIKTDEFGEPVFKDIKIYHCSKCNRKTVIRECYCPSCRAKMDLER